MALLLFMTIMHLTTSQPTIHPFNETSNSMIISITLESPLNITQKSDIIIGISGLIKQELFGQFNATKLIIHNIDINVTEIKYKLNWEITTNVKCEYNLFDNRFCSQLKNKISNIYYGQLKFIHIHIFDIGHDYDENADSGETDKETHHKWLIAIYYIAVCCCITIVLFALFYWQSVLTKAIYPEEYT